MTWRDPRGGRSGEFIYSAGLIEAFARAGARIDVVCLTRDEADPSIAEFTRRGVVWRCVRAVPRPPWLSLASTLPNVAWRASRGDITRTLDQRLDAVQWDCVVLDALHGGWALGAVTARRRRDGRRRPRLVYLAHNHEESTRRAVARSVRGDPLKRLALSWDAAKAARLERRLTTSADIVTAITEDDAARFRARRGTGPVLVLPPGYDGPRRRERRIGPDTPRLVVMVGSFHWIAKRMNLERFVAVADPIFAAAGAELRVVGDGPEEMFRRLRATTRATTFTGAVADIDPHVADARMALVPEEAGGGFKLKVLDYVFRRLPIAALAGSVAGTPLAKCGGLAQFATMQALAEGAVAMLDDDAALNRMQERAYAACAMRFDWASRGTALCRAIAELP